MTDVEDISDLWEEALDRYEKLSPKRSRRDQNILLTIKTPEDLDAHITKHEESFKLFRSKHEKLTRRLKACMKPFMALSDMISAAVSASPFAPASTILGAVCFVLKAAEGVSEVYDWIEELFDKLRDFTVRLDEYVQLGFSKGFRNKIIDIFGCLLEILACAEATIKSGRWKKYAAVLFLGGDEHVKAAFEKLAGLFQSEQSLVLAITYVTNQKMSRRIDEIGKVSDAILDATQTFEKEKIRHDCLEWISTVDFSGQQSDYLEQRQAQTGYWFLQESLFKSWVTASSQTWALSCPGNPGAGKTTMAATIIHYLSNLGTADKIAVAYIYCNYQRRTEQTLYDLLTALLRRLVQVQSMVPQCILDMHERLHDQRRLTLQEATNLIAPVCKDLSTVYLVIDALDECQDHVSRNLLQIMTSVHEKANIRVLVTTRFITSVQDIIAKELGSPPQLEVRASDSDVRQYFLKRQPDFPNFLKNDASLCNLACDKVVEAAGGMFLLARLHIDQLISMVVPAQVKSAVSKMFSVSHDRSQIIATYNERYDLALERITNQPSYQAELARATLAWITFAYRPLTPAELCHALAMSLTDDHTNLSQDYLPEVGLLVSICAGLVTVDEQVNVVRPVHYTTQEYLKRTYEVWFPSCRNHLASTCISYLLLDEFKKGGIKSTSEDEDEYQRRLTRYPFFSYVAHYWGKHAQLVEDVVLTGICTVLKHDDILDSISSVTTCSWDHGNYDFINIRRWKKLSPLLIIARDGLLQTLQYYLSEGHIEAKSDNHEHIIISIGSDSVLSVAAANGHLDVVKTILDQTVDISLQDGSGQALIEAASGGFADIAQLILDFWTKLTQSQPLSTEEISEAMDRALNEAAGSSRKEMMQLLFREGAHIRYCMAQYIDNDPEKGLRLALQMGFEVDARDYFGNTALQTAANRGYTQSVQILLEHGADASAKSKEMGPPLEEAAYEQHKNTIQVLIDHGVDVEAQCSQCDTALVAALCAENWAWDFNVVRLLLEAGAQPDKHHHQDTRLALHRAAYAGYTDFCELLLLHGADVNLRSGAPPQSALEEAYKVARANVVRLLLSKGAQAPEGGLSFSGEFMYYWVQNEKYAIEVLKLFREHRIKMDFVGNGAHLPAIYEAAQMGCSKVLNELLDLGADINVQAGKHGNVLHTAIVGKESDSSGDPDCVIILLDHGADINGSGLVHSTPLGAAIEASSGTFGTDEIFRTLVERGAKVGHHGPALLGPAVASGQKYIVQYLLTAGVDMESLPMSPNLLATACRLDRSEEILTILLDAGADIQMWGPAALHQAVSAYKPDAVRWLLQHGVDANEPSEDCPNALITCVSAPPNAIYEMNFVAPIIETLTEHGADLETHGPAALELAIANDYSSKIRVLLGGTPKPHAEGDDYDSDGFGFRDITIRHRDDD